ncbi:MAG: T9SS type A sorting domain-containing protein [Bacteroidetes bacterium]|nr:T9SS type A sorting domain-containing protein [Bacteroidota bacterium]
MKINIKLCLSIIGAIIFHGSVSAQFSPPAGQPGSTAIHKDSSIIIGWAMNCTVERGYINIADTSVTSNGSNKATYGSYLYATGPSDEYVVSLGDRGSATLGFNPPVVNREGPDFAVFENSFGDLFLELAFVEVSSDGIRFVRFPAVSLIQEDQQIPTFGTIDATLIHNFAGKYRMSYGTPFDLEDLKDSASIDLNHITYIRIIDVVGCIAPALTSYDSQGHKVNDPWPTPFETGGFDLDAIGVINNTTKQSGTDEGLEAIRTYPNPVDKKLTIDAVSGILFNFDLLNPEGLVLHHDVGCTKVLFDMSPYPAGLYIARFSLNDGTTGFRKIVKK